MEKIIKDDRLRRSEKIKRIEEDKIENEKKENKDRQEKVDQLKMILSEELNDMNEENL